jgi:hypothetical protein
MAELLGLARRNGPTKWQKEESSSEANMKDDRMFSSPSGEQRSAVPGIRGETPMQRPLQELEESLARMERELQAMRRQSRIVRWLVLVVLAAGLIFVGTRSTATQSAAAMRIMGLHTTRITEPLIVEDAAGKTILQVGTTPLGRGMILFDEAGKMICGIGTTAQGRGLVVSDAQEKLIGALGEGHSPDTTALGRGLTVFDPSQRTVAALGTGSNLNSHGRGITINDETGTPLAGLGVWPQRPDGGQLILTDRSGNRLFAQPPLP